MENYKNKSLTPKERAADLLSRMSSNEKLAQIQCYFFKSEDVNDMAEAFPLGVGEVSCLEMRSMETLDQAIYLQHAIQSRVIHSSPHGIPAIFHMEGLCGLLLKDAMSFPCGLGRAASFDPALEEEIGRIVGRQAAAMGISHILAPVLDVSRNPRFGRYGETYGEDAALVSAMGTAYTKGLQDEGGRQLRVESVAKHFTGSHENQAGLHTASAEISSQKLREVYAKPFQAAISEGGLRGVMPCYNSLNGMPVSGSRQILTELLREEMGFDGVTVSDYNAILKMVDDQCVCETRGEAAVLALKAGVDVELPTPNCYSSPLLEKLTGGELDMALLDRAVSRVLEAKFRMGLFEHPYALQGDEFDRAFYSQKDGNISKQSALESIVLLKNNGILPLRKDPRRIAVIGWHGDTIRALFGGYTHLSMAEGLRGDLSAMADATLGGKRQRKSYPCYQDSHVTDEAPFREEYERVAKTFYPHTRSLLEQLRVEFPDSEVIYAYGYDFAGSDESKFHKALSLAKTCDLTILTLGGKHGTGFTSSTGENLDSTSINLPPCQEAFIEEVRKVCSKLIGIHFDGRPISSNNADRYLDAILEAWSPSEFGTEAVCDVLTGRFNPCGKLPVTIAINAGQTPIHYNHDHNSGYRRNKERVFPGYSECTYEPRYYFGFGLSYTSFDYSDLRISQEEYWPGETVDVTVRVTNTGNTAGTEIVQLYIEDVVGSTTRPVMELEGAARVFLEPKECKSVRFTFQLSQIALLDRTGQWKIESGIIRVMVGSSSKDIALTGAFRIAESQTLTHGRNRGFFAKSEILEENVS